MNQQQIRNLQPHNLEQFRHQKMTHKEIAKLCGVSESVIQTRLKEYKIKKYAKKTKIS